MGNGDKDIERFQPVDEVELIPAGLSEKPMPLDHKMFEVAQRMPDRNIDEIKRRVIEEATRAPEDMTYKWSLRTGGIVKGPTVKLANIIFRNWGMMGAHAEIVKDNSAVVIVKHQIVDFKTITIFPPRFFKQNMNTSLGSGMEAERQRDILLQIAQSKNQRNAELNALPDFLVNEAIAACESESLTKIRELGILKAIKRATTFLAENGIGEGRIVAKYKKPLAEFLDTDVLSLWQDCAAIKDGVILATASFPEPKTEPETKPSEKAPAKPQEPTKEAPRRGRPPKTEAAPQEPPKAEKPAAPKEPLPQEQEPTVDLFDDLKREEEEQAKQYEEGSDDEPEPVDDFAVSPDVEIMLMDAEKEFGAARVSKYLDAVLEKGWNYSTNEDRVVALRTAEQSFRKAAKNGNGK